MILDYAALAVIFFILVLITVVIVFIGSTPGKIARRRGHPWPDAVNAASWIGLATGVLWPFAFVWAFLPLPTRPSSSDSSEPAEDPKGLADRVASLEATINQLQKQAAEKGGAA